MKDAVSRQQRRKRTREQIKTGHALMASGLPAKPGRAALRDIAHVMHAVLVDRSNPRRAGEAAGLAHEIAETALRRHPAPLEIACRRGCSYCCYSYVGVVPPEVFRIAATINKHRRAGLTTDVVIARAVPLRGVTPAARVGAKLACPLLENGQCGVYADRPLTCRQATSLSVEACREEYEGEMALNEQIEVSATHLAHASNAHVALLGAMRGAGLPTIAYELSAALSTALDTPDAERRWLDGEDVFRDVQQNAERPANVELIARMIAEDVLG